MATINYKVVFDGPIDDNLRKRIEDGFLEKSVDDAQTNVVIGVDFYTKSFDLYDKKIRTQVWILSQDQMFKTIKAVYYKGANLVIYVKSDNSSTIEKLIGFAKNVKINPNNIILIDTSDDFTEVFFEFAISISLYHDGLISSNTLREKEIVYEKGRYPKFTILSDYLDSEEYEIKNLKKDLRNKEELIDQLKKMIKIKDKQIKNLKNSLQSKDKLIRSQINEMKIITNSAKIKEKELEELRKDLKLKDKQINDLKNSKS